LETDLAADAAAREAAESLDECLTLGVEEEFLLVDPASGQVVSAAGAVFDGIPDGFADLVQREFLATQLEIATPPTSDLDTLRASLADLRRTLCDAASGAGVRLAAIGTGPLVLDRPPELTPMPRYERMVREYGAIWPNPGLCACHVHVGMPDRELGVQVLNRIRGWLPVLQAATSNSPYADGVDTGYASWRSVQWRRWPSAGPPPHLHSAAHYDAVVDGLIGAGAMLDIGMLYWYARLSAHVPTVEVRVGDVCPTVDDTMLIAALVRALVATAVAEVAAGQPPLLCSDWLVDAAHWRASRDGLDGIAVDTVTGGIVPAWKMLRALVSYVTPALDRHGDRAEVERLVTDLVEHGDGATRQRRAFAEHGNPGRVVLTVADGTRP